MVKALIFTSKKLSRDYQIVDTLEAGIVLQGWEVKSIKARRASFHGAFVIYDFDKSLLLMKGLSVPAWTTAPKVSERDQKRDRILLTSKKEAIKLGLLAKQPGYTLIPKAVYVNDKDLIKVEIGVVKGKKKFEKKQMLKEKDIQRQIEMDMKNRF